MPSVRFTRNIQRHVEYPTLEVSGATLREVLDSYFQSNAQARGYVLDDTGQLRKHMAAFIDGRQIDDRERLSDSAASWTEITGVKPSAFGFPVAANPNNPDTAWFVPGISDEKRYPVDGRVVVNRTRDGGRSFETLTRGLPHEHSYDLVYRHALDVDDAGQSLAMGSTTGSVWTSDDGGDSWQTVSSNLPPVYAVRFEKKT